MDQLTFYIIFHKKIFPENTPPFPCFTYMAANELISKDIDINKLQHTIVNEFDTPGYNPLYQMLNFCDNSVILNYPSPPTPYIGLCQYDMYIHPDKFKLVFNTLIGSNKVIGFYPYSVNTILDILSESQWNEILSSYNSKNNTYHSIQSLQSCPFFLMNAYIIPSWFYTKLQSTAKTMLPLVFKFLKYDMRHIAGTLERLNSLFIACAIHENVLSYSISDAIIDNRSQTIPDSIRH